MFSLVPPVGSEICLDETLDDSGPAQVESRLYGSGTAALAAALRWVAGLKRSATEVLLPAYGCPALVSAAQFAGLRPVLVDLAPDSPFAPADGLARAVTSQTAALVHVNFLGFPPPMPVPGSGDLSTPFHVYDSCQAWPDGGLCAPWADVTVVSFGRGKPVTLGVGGGIIPNVRHHDLVPGAPPAVSGNALAFRARAFLYGLVMRPRLYWWVDRLPWLGIGLTRFQPLREIGGIDVHAKRLIAANIEKYRRSGGWSLARIRRFFDIRRLEHFKLPSGLSGGFEKSRLLRLPLVAESKSARDRSIAVLRRAGFSATAMYGAPLWTFSGLEFLREFERKCPNATTFADRLLTLPAHSGVDDDMMELMLRHLEGI